MSDFVLQTKCVFLDTNIYQGKNFQFLTYELERLSLLASAGYIQLLMSPIVDFEIREHISSGAANAFSKIKDFKKEAMVLRNLTELPVSGVFERVSGPEISTALNKNYDIFLDLAKPQIVPLEGVDVSRVFERYFTRRAPFSQRKKNEFPDGFVLFSLVKYSHEHNVPVYVVSTDGDMESFCSEFPSLIHLSDLDPVLDPLKHVGPFDPGAFAGQMLDKLRAEVIDAAKSYLGLLEFNTDRIIDDVVSQSVSFEELKVVDAELYEVRVGHAEFDLVIALEIWADQIVNLRGFDDEQSDRIRKLSKFHAVIDMPVIILSEGYNLETAYLRDVDPVLRTELSLCDAFSVEELPLE